MQQTRVKQRPALLTMCPRAADATPEEEAELLIAIAEADRGELVPAGEVLAKLARRHG
jgi:hypothetical protein